MSDTPRELQHIGFIMDGNRTWARWRWLPQLEWHRRGYNNMEDIMDICLSKGIPYVSFWALSDDNIAKRSEEEVKYLFDLLAQWIPRMIKKSNKKNVRLFFVGNQNLLREDCAWLIQKATKDTEKNTWMKVIVAIWYGWQDEIVRGIQKLAATGKDMTTISLQDIIPYMDSWIFPAPDLIVRTGWHSRHSWFFLFQSPYSEYAFSQKNWPDFNESDIDTILDTFHVRIRKFGK